MKPFHAQTFYELLAVSEDCSPDVLREAFEQRATLPDREAIALFQLASPADLLRLRERLQEAFDVLNEPTRRLAYDSILAIGASPMPAQLVMKDVLSSVEGPRTTPPQPLSYMPRSTRPSPAKEDPPAPASPPPASVTHLKPVRPIEPELKEGGSEGPARPALVALSSGSMRPAPRPSSGHPVEADEPQVASRSSPRRLEIAAQLSQDSAIGIAEASLAQLTARVREARPAPAPEARPKAFDVPPEAEFNGELLRKVRQARGLSLGQLAERTRISRNHLENIEADRYDALPATVYLRGILMNLARELGLDGLRVSKSYLAIVARTQK